jgi:hypothetical protein
MVWITFAVFAVFAIAWVVFYFLTRGKPSESA